MITQPTAKNISLWHDTEKMPRFSPLRQNIATDVCVVGGGIAGLTTAYLLIKEGKTVCLLEDFELGSGQSGRTTAHFVTALDDRYFEIEKYHGKKSARVAAESHSAAIDKVAMIVEEEKINCDLERIDGYLFADLDKRVGVLQKELEAVHKAGLFDVEMVNKSPLPSFDTGPCLRFPQQLQLHPIKYMRGLAKAIVERGGQIFTHTHVMKVNGGSSATVVTRDEFTVQCKSVVVATNTPINDLLAMHTKQAPYRTYVIGLLVPKDTIPKGLYWDTLDPYHYIRLQPGLANGSPATHDVLIIGGEDHKTGQDENPELRFNKLEAWARARFPMATDLVYHWSGQIMEPVDSLGYLGHNPLDRNNVYIITGDSGNGMTHTTIGAIIVCDQIMGRKNPWEEVYSPSRISIRATPEFLRENANVAFQYKDWLSFKVKPDLDTLPFGEGIVFRDGLNMIAAYKDEKGQIEFMSAACPHLKGVVSWNAVENSWDCPCHGSRFDCHGTVIEGPAFKDLKKIDPLDLDHSELLYTDKRPLPPEENLPLSPI
jgi:glycine/D-amino acid oxidase-like deaminating enzyme/nitrite reductase/ring-hydroxylating ferredoxin subunit